MTKGEFIRLEDNGGGGENDLNILTDGQSSNNSSSGVIILNNDQHDIGVEAEIESDNQVLISSDINNKDSNIPNGNNNNSNIHINNNNNNNIQQFKNSNSNNHQPIEFALSYSNGGELNEDDFITPINDIDYKEPFSQYMKNNYNNNIYERILQQSEKLKVDALMHRSELILTASYLFCFVALGIGVGSLGPTLHSFTDHLNASIDEVGYFFSARGLGYFFFSLGCRFLDRVKNSNLIMGGCVILMSISLLLIPLSKNIYLTAFLFCLEGGGAGLMDSGLNTLIVWVWKDKVNPFMQLLHFSFGFGAFVAPLIVSGMSESSLFTKYLVLSIIMFSSVIIIFLKPAISPDKIITVVDENNNNQSGGENQEMVDNENKIGNGDDSQITTISKAEKYLRIEVIVSIAIFLFFYVGAESGYGGWLATYSIENLKFSEKTGALINSLYWGSFTVGRLAGVFVSLVLSPQKMVILDTLGCFFFTILIIIFPGSSTILWISTTGLGISLASIFPTAFSLPQNLDIPVTGEATSYMVIGAVAGEIVIPWAIGMFQTKIGMHVLPWIVFFTLLISLFIYIAINLRTIQVRAREKGQEITLSFSNSVSLLNHIVNNNNRSNNNNS